VAFYHEVIPHVLMGEIAQWAQQVWVSGNHHIVRAAIAGAGIQLRLLV
jgi:hypothetical protein